MAALLPVPAKGSERCSAHRIPANFPPGSLQDLLLSLLISSGMFNPKGTSRFSSLHLAGRCMEISHCNLQSFQWWPGLRLLQVLMEMVWTPAGWSFRLFSCQQQFLGLEMLRG